MSLKGASVEVNGFSAPSTAVRLVELVREDLLLLPALRALANKGAEILEAFVTRAMSGCLHSLLLS
jgi:hypothetical protein